MLRPIDNVNVTITLPKPLTIVDISYVAIWCQSSRRIVGHVNLPPLTELPAPVPAYIERPYLGKYLGVFHIDGSAGNNGNNVRGTVYAVNESMLVIKDFSFDGFAGGMCVLLYIRGLLSIILISPQGNKVAF